MLLCCAKSLQLCLTFCDPMDYNLPGFSVHGILQARILEWVVFAVFQGIFSTQGSNPLLLRPLHWQAGSLPPAPPGKPLRDHQIRSVAQSCPTLCDPMNYSPLASLSMGFSRQKYSSGLPCPPPGDLPNPGIESPSLTSPALAGGFFTTSATWEAPILVFGTLKF